MDVAQGIVSSEGRLVHGRDRFSLHGRFSESPAVASDLCSLSRHDQPCFEREPTLQDFSRDCAATRHLLRKGIPLGTEHDR